MKTNIKSVATILFASMTMMTTAQIDRSKMPVSGATPTINLGTPTTFKMPNGLTVLIVENHKLPRVSLSLSMDVPPYVEGSKAGIADLTSALMGNGSVNIPKDEFNEEVDFLSGNISLSSRGGYASSLSKYFPRIVELMADAAINPNFTQEELDKEKAKLIEAIKSGENNADNIAQRVRNSLIYSKEHPYGEYATEQTINSITLEDVKSFYKENFSPADAYLVISGDIKADVAKEMINKYFYPWMKSKALQKTVSDPIDVQYTQVNFVDMPNAVQSEIRVANLVNLKMSDKDYFPVLIANYILGGGFGSYINMNLREKNGYTYVARSSVGNDKWGKTIFGVSTKVRNAVTDSAVVEILKEIKRIREEDVTDESIAQAKSQYLGNFIMATENPQTTARYAINIKTQNLPDDFYKNYIANINAVTKEDVKRVANKYFNADNLRIVIAGKGAEVADNLEALTYNGKKLPVFYFDKEANRIEKPNFSKPIPQGVNSQSIINNYINAIAPESVLKNVKTTLVKANGTVQGMTLDLAIKRSGNDKFSQTIGMMGNVMSKQVYNNGVASVEAQGQKIPVSDKDIAAMKAEAGIIPEKNMDISELKLIGIETVNGEDAYVLQVSDNKKAYFSTATGLKIREVTSQEMGGQTMEAIFDYSDYRDVKGMKFPYKLAQQAGGMNIEFNVTEAKINEDVTDADFQ
ncbi:MAG: pitrilysin family protein [Capnocytophaga sp.]|nr:pitrilysin family protein [Capnocytophaga sp.]